MSLVRGSALKQLAGMVESGGMSTDDLIERFDAAKDRLRHYQGSVTKATRLTRTYHFTS